MQLYSIPCEAFFCMWNQVLKPGSLSVVSCVTTSKVVLKIYEEKLSG